MGGGEFSTQTEGEKNTAREGDRQTNRDRERQGETGCQRNSERGGELEEVEELERDGVGRGGLWVLRQGEVKKHVADPITRLVDRCFPDG